MPNFVKKVLTLTQRQCNPDLRPGLDVDKPSGEDDARAEGLEERQAPLVVVAVEKGRPPPEGGQERAKRSGDQDDEHRVHSQSVAFVSSLPFLRENLVGATHYTSIHCPKRAFISWQQFNGLAL